MHIEPGASFHQIAGTVVQFHNALLHKGMTENVATELTKQFLHTMIVAGFQNNQSEGDNE